MSIHADPVLTSLPPADPAATWHGGEAACLAAVIEAQGEVAGARLDDPWAVMDVVVNRIQKLTNADGALIELAEGDHLVCRAASGMSGAALGSRTPLGSGFSGQCVGTGTVLTCEDTEFEPAVDRDACRKAGVGSFVMVPLRHGGRIAGVLQVVSARPSPFARQHVPVMQLMAGMLTTALAHAAEYNAKQAVLAERTQALEAVRRTNLALRESEARFRSSFDNAAIGMALVGLDGRWLKVNRSLCEIVGYDERELLAVTFQDITHPDDLDADLDLVRRVLAGEVRTYQLNKRYVHRNGHVIWVLLSVSVVRNDAGEPLYFVSQVQDVTDRERGDRLEAARSRVLEMIAADQPLQPVMMEVLSMVEGQLPGTSPAFVVLNDGAMQQLSLTLPRAVQDGVSDRAISLAAHLCAHAVGHEPSVTVSDLRTDPTWEPVRGAALESGLAACWTVPVRSKDATFRAMLMVYGSGHRQPDAREMRVLDTAGKLALVATEHFQMTRQLAHLARHDSLTGLPNRAVFEDRLQQALAAAKRTGGGVAVLALDLDHFKKVNDTLGHQAGDSLLQSFGQRVRAAVRENDTVARLGGDEFAILLPSVISAGNAAQVAKKLTEVLSAPFVVAGQELTITGSIGVAIFPADGEDGAALQRSADAALYRVKEKGRNGFELA